MLFNTNPYNTGVYNGPPLSAATVATDLVVFNGYSLADNSITFTTNLQDSAPEREILTGRIPRGDGVYVNGDFWRKKPIVVQGIITKSTSALLETELDTIRKKLAARQSNLDITRNSVTRRYVASWVNPQEIFAQRQHFHTTTCPFRAVFECHEPFAKDKTYTSSSEAVTTSPHNINVENTGTIDAEPVFYLIFNAASSVTAVNVQRIDGGGNILDEIEYSGTISTNDVLKFDSEIKTVELNGSEVNYTGGFPVLPAGGNIIQFTITGTSFSVYLTAKHKNTFL